MSEQKMMRKRAIAERKELDLAGMSSELTRLARRGFSAPLLLDLKEFPILQQLVGEGQMSASERATRLNALLQRAIAQLPEPNKRAMAAFGEMDETTAGRSLGTRRQAAAEALGVAPTTFRTHRESRLLEELARTLMIEAAESITAVERLNVPANDRVFVVHTREAADHPLFDLLRAWGLRPQSSWGGWGWGDPTSEATFDLLQMIDHAAVIVVLLTPTSASDIGGGPGAARDNLVFELGLVLGAASDRTVIVSHGEVKLPSGLAGRPVVELNNRPTSRNALRSRLQALGLELEDSLGWLDPAVGGDFESPAVGATLDDDLWDAIEGKGFAPGESLGKGGNGSTWSAMERETGEIVLVKEFASPIMTKRKRWCEAVNSAASIDIQGLPKVKEVIETSGGVAMIVEAVDGIPLGEIGVISPEESVRIAIALVEVVTALHSKGIVHGDLSPSNILVAEGGRPILVDFGTCSPVESLNQHDDTRAVGMTLLSLLKSRHPAQGTEQEIATLDASEDLKRQIRRLLGLEGRPPGSAEELLRGLRATPEAARA
jgi:tRNA A-37 threonylcarbamoyl transferase component Bud32/predicted nucleotide-binding protein